MKKIVSLLVLVVLMLSINSCREDELQNELNLQLKAAQTKDMELIGEAQNWFENNPQQNQFKLFESTENLKWENAVVNDLDSITVIEVSVKLTGQYKVKEIDNEKLNVEHRLLIFKENDSFYSLMEYFISERDLEYLQDVEKIKYSKKDDDFEGIMVLVNDCNEVVSTEWISKKVKSAEVRLKSGSGYCVWLVWIYADGTIENIAKLFCILPEQDSGSGGTGGGSGGTVGTEPGEDTNDLPVVDVTSLDQNAKAKCIYDKLLNGGILKDFMERYFGITRPFQSFLGELDLTWTLGTTTQTLPIGVPNNGVYNSVVIQLNESTLNTGTSTSTALNMLHEALHAKLIAEVYDEVGSTDFDKLYQYYKGWGLNNIDKQQELEMLNFYCTDIATGLKRFDENQGIFKDIETYKKAIRYDLSGEIFDVTRSTSDYAAYLELLVKSTKDCY